MEAVNLSYMSCCLPPHTVIANVVLVDIIIFSGQTLISGDMFRRASEFIVIVFASDYLGWWPPKLVELSLFRGPGLNQPNPLFYNHGHVNFC